MSLTAAVSGLVLFLLSVQGIQGQNDCGVTYTSTKICALKGSTVEIRCSYRHPSRRYYYGDTRIKETFWYTKMNGGEPVDLITEPEYSGRVQYHCENKDCTLRITDLRESDSAKYKFMFTTNQEGWSHTGEPGVTLTVTDLQVQVRGWFSTWLDCYSSYCRPDNPSYIWFKNGQKVQAETSYLHNPNSADSYSCAFKGYEDFSSPSVCVNGESCNRVMYAERRICAFKGSSVDIKCTYASSNGSITSKFWFSPELNNVWETSSWSFRVQVIETESGRSTLRVTNLRDSDSAQYRFKFQTPSFEWRSSLPGTTLTVTALQVQVTRLSVSQSYIEAELKCHSSCNPAAPLSYIWFKNGRKIQKKETFTYKDRFYLGDIISCALKGHEDHRSPSVYAPKLPSVSVSPSAEKVEGSSVTLTCSSDANPAAKYTWYKETRNPELLSERPQFVFRSIQSSDSGQYYCAAENELGRKTSGYISINVKYAPKLPSVSVSPSAEIVEGSSVTLTCSSDANPAAVYTWYKKSRNPEPLSKGPQFVFRSIQSSDSGQYYCTAENKLGRKTSGYIFINVKYAPKLPSVSVSPSAEIVEGSSVTLTCSSDANPAAVYTWYNNTRNAEPLSEGPQFVIRSIQSFHSGQYYCVAENKLGRTSTNTFIDVKYAPKLPSVSVSPSADVVEGSSVTLTCSSDANPAANYTWYKENQTLLQGPEDSYHFISISLEDSGNYSCKSENQYGSINSSPEFIDVQYAPKLPSVSVSPSAAIVEGSSVNLTCSSDANPAANYTWYKETQTLLQGPEERYHFKSISSDDRGVYYCKSENQYGSIKASPEFIDVQYAPKLPSVSVSPSAEIVEGSSVTLTCSSDANPAANYTWYKENQTLLQGPEGRYHFKFISSEDRGVYYCKSENQYGSINSLPQFIDVQYAPKLPSVSVSPSAEIVEGSSVTLTCSSDANPAANYTWYKENQALLQGPEDSYHFISISLEDSGNYSCKSENQYGSINSSTLFIDVEYAPKLPSVSVSPSAEIVEGSSVTLTCSSDANPAANYTWYKEDQTLLQGPEGRYHFKSISSEDRGVYYCKSENQYGSINSSTFFIHVQYSPKLPSVSVSPSAEIVEGSSVTLTCSSDANPAANYTWYKENQTLLQGPEDSYHFTSISLEDSGKYSCKSENQYGSIKSSTVQIDVQYQSTTVMHIIRFTLVVVMPILLFLYCLCMRKKTSTTEPNKPKEMMELDSFPIYESIPDTAART